MMTDDDKKRAEKSQNFECKICDFNTSKKNNYTKHIETDKHKRMTSDDFNPAKQAKQAKYYICECGKTYKYRQGLSLHKKKCNQFQIITNVVEIKEEIKAEIKGETEVLQPSPDVIILKEILFEMINQNKELQKTIQEMIPKIGNNNKVVNNNIVNNNLTLLNTNCKSALTLNEFVESIEVGIKDLVYTSEKGLANGITNLFLEHYNKLPFELRPVWCVDRKRKKLYIKEAEWEEDISNQKMKAAIINLTVKQARSSGKYTKENPDWMQHDDKKDQFVHIVRNTTQDMDEIKQTHIISNLLDTFHLTDSVKTELQSL